MLETTSPTRQPSQCVDPAQTQPLLPSPHPVAAARCLPPGGPPLAQLLPHQPLPQAGLQGVPQAPELGAPLQCVYPQHAAAAAAEVHPCSPADVVAHPPAPGPVPAPGPAAAADPG